MSARIPRQTGRAWAVALAVLATVAPIGASASGGARQPETAPPTPAAAPPGPQGPFCSSIPAEGEGSFEGMADDPVAIAASNNPYLTTLASAVQTAGLADTLTGEGPFTVFAPSNEAFAAIPIEELDAVLADVDHLTEILLLHVIVGESLSADELVARGEVASAEGAVIRFSRNAEGLMTINDVLATTVCADIPTANATVHVIDRFLISVDRLVSVL